MRWKSWAGGLALLLTVVGGCKQKLFITEGDYAGMQVRLPDCLEHRTDVQSEPTIPPTGAPPTVHDLDRPIKYLSLAEAVATALEQGTVGQPSLLFPGIGLDNLIQLGSPGNGVGGVAGSDNIRVLSVDPARAGANLEASLSRFDAVFTSSVNWNNTDQPIATALQNFQAGNTGLNAIVQQQVTANASVFKPLPTGGIAGITFNVPYTFTNLPARVNPAYQPQLVFQFEQPLLQGFGVEINQLRTQHPAQFDPFGLTQNLYGPGLSPTAEGILITRLRFDQQRGEFERNLNQMLLNVETAYWNLYGSYWNLYSREQGLRFAFEAYKLSKAGYDAGRVKAADYYQSRGQYELFRSQRLQAVQTILENERQLRALMGLPASEGNRLVPADAPTLAPFQPDWSSALHEALSKRPELIMARLDVKANQMNVILQKNSLLPDLRAFASYDLNSIGSRLDGPDTNNAFRTLASNGFNDWTVGLRLQVPLGYRIAHAQLRQAQLSLARSYEVLHDNELKAERFLALEYSRMPAFYEQVRAQRAQREAFGEQLRARQQEYLAGRGTLDILLEAQRFWADALANEYQAIVSYNNALCAFEFAKGTILQHDNISVAEGPLPGCAAERAVEHERERTKALVLKERALPPKLPSGTFVTPVEPIGLTPPPGLDKEQPPSLPAMWDATAPLKDVPDLKAHPGAAPVEKTKDEVFPPSLLSAGDKPAGQPKAASDRAHGIKPGPKANDFGTVRPTAPGDAVPPPGPGTPAPLPTSLPAPGLSGLGAPAKPL
jgi:outer membrane protein TolC